MTMARKNLKVPESLFLALRDDKPDSMTWPTYLETRCLGGEGVSHPSPNPDEIAEAVAERIDYAAIADTTSEQVVRELQ
jgi:hypothetical protein